MSPEWWTVLLTALGFLFTFGAVCVIGGRMLQRQSEHGAMLQDAKVDLTHTREEIRKDIEAIRDDMKEHGEEDKKAFAVIFDRTGTHTAEIGFLKEQIGAIKGFHGQPIQVRLLPRGN